MNKITFDEYKAYIGNQKEMYFFGNREGKSPRLKVLRDFGVKTSAAGYNPMAGCSEHCNQIL
jgi:hypothetical protein